MAIDLIRNFSIVAHIDHGKSTLADRLLSLTGTMDAKKAVDQVLDSMDLEKERGITIKAHTVRLLYKAHATGRNTRSTSSTPPATWTSPTRSPARWPPAKGAMLIVDAAQGVEAQTLANFYLALDGGLEIIPVINKIDLPAADLEGTREPDHRDPHPGRRRGPGHLGQARHRRARGAGGDRRAHPAAEGRRRTRRSRRSSSTRSTTPTRAWWSTSGSSTGGCDAGDADPPDVQRQEL